MSANQKPIPGIYNYCDRWCERCSFTARCAVFKQQSSVPPEAKDQQNEAFWKQLSHNFAQIHRILEEGAKKWGIDLNAVPKEELDAIGRRQEDLRQRVKSHPLAQLTTQYYKAAELFFKEEDLLKEDGAVLVRQVALGLQTEAAAQQQLIHEKDCLEVIQWYLFFIHTKFSRALHGLLNDDGWEAENSFQRDCDGSAKVALIAVARSLQAWVQLLQFMPDKEDKMLPILALLQKIEREGRNVFPQAASFKRPGFDDVQL